MSIEDLVIEHLSIDDRLALAEQLWTSVADEMERQPLSDEQRAEIERRIQDADNNPDRGIPWETIRAEARARWKR